MATYKSMDEKPVKNGTYLVKFRNRSMPEYDCIELAFRNFQDGTWDNLFYGYDGDGYEPVGWCE